MERNTEQIKLLAVSAGVFLLAALTYTGNVFKTADPALFQTFQQDSDRLVLDALRLGESFLGIAMDEGFQIYPSQFGAQLPLLRALGGLASWSPESLSRIVAITMAATVAIATYMVGRRLFHPVGAAAFGLLLTLSPMTVMIAGSVYWMAWSWFLPFLISLWLGPRLWTGRGLAMAALAWWATLTLTNLFGYEYASAIAIAAAAPIVFVGLRMELSVVRVAFPCLVLGAMSVLAMATALSLHAWRLPTTVDGRGGWDQIALIAEKSTTRDSDPATLRAACDITPSVAVLDGEERATQRDVCVRNLERSQKASTAIILVSYATFRRTVPWLGMPDLLDDSELVPVRHALRRGDLGGALSGLGQTNATLSNLLALPATMALVWLAIVVAAWQIWRRRGRGGGAQAAMLGVAAAAPLSWFVLASAHSYGHMHISFVLWTLPFFPMLLAVIVDSGREAEPVS